MTSEEVLRALKALEQMKKKQRQVPPRNRARLDNEPATETRSDMNCTGSQQNSVVNITIGWRSDRDIRPLGPNQHRMGRGGARYTRKRFKSGLCR